MKPRQQDVRIKESSAPHCISKDTMITAQFPYGAEISRNQTFFRSVPDALPESVVQQQPEPQLEVLPTPTREPTKTVQNNQTR